MNHNATTKQSFFVSGVCCAAEETIVRKHLDALVGADRYTFNPLTYELCLRDGMKSKQVVQKLMDAGFAARSKQDLERPLTFRERHMDGAVAGVAALFALTGIILEQIGMPDLVVHGTLLGAIVIGGWKVAVRAWKSVRTFAFDMNVLMSVAVMGAMLIGKWGEAAAVVVLYAISLMLESYSNARTRRAIQSLVILSPPQACVILDGKESVVSAQDLIPGQYVIIRPGERIPIDGIVVGGRSFVDQSAITGEATPVSRNIGQQVYAGSMNQQGALQVKTISRYEDSTIAKIVHLVEEAQLKRAPIQNAVDRFARIYTPTILVVAIGVAVLPPLLLGASFGDWLYRALVLLVIACPCALVISTPVTIVSALTRAARMGILIKGGRQLETIANIQALAFDKTGTLTHGRPRVTDIVPLNSLSHERILQVVAALEHRSEHPLASAILQEARRLSIEYGQVSVAGFEALPGRGVKATVDGTQFFLGNHQLCEEVGFCSPVVERTLEQFEGEGKTVMILGKSNDAIGVLAVRDTARDHGSRTVSALKGLGIENLWLLSGDQELSVRRLAEEAGIKEYRAALLPQQKIEIIEQLKTRYGTVAMVGDGINDVPALAAASVGIAMGVSGSDAALETADVVLTGDNLSRIPLLVQLSRNAMSIVRQNIAIALSLKLLFLILSVTGEATLWMAVLADDGAALIVILNGLRALSFGKET